MNLRLAVALDPPGEIPEKASRLAVFMRALDTISVCHVSCFVYTLILACVTIIAADSHDPSQSNLASAFASSSVEHNTLLLDFLGQNCDSDDSSTSEGMYCCYVVQYATKVVIDEPLVNVPKPQIRRRRSQSVDSSDSRPSRSSSDEQDSPDDADSRGERDVARDHSLHRKGRRRASSPKFSEAGLLGDEISGEEHQEVSSQADDDEDPERPEHDSDSSKKSDEESDPEDRSHAALSPKVARKLHILSCVRHW